MDWVFAAHAQSARQDWEKAAGGKQQFEVASVREDKDGGGSYSNFELDWRKQCVLGDGQE